MYMYFSRDGSPISVIEWADAPKIDRRVAETTLSDGKWISTVWLGLNHRLDDGPPLIFETMVFPSDMERYATESEAIEGHNRMVEKWSHILKVEKE